jgi:[methyl-Co(III) methanol-specific corrinoid protein]:coenzyme M methyltransferase
MPVATNHPIQEVGQIEIPENILEKPSLRVVLDAISLLRRQYGDQVSIVGKVMGPWTISYHLASTEEFLVWTITDPDKVRGYLERLKEVSIAFARAQLQAGADTVVVADHATGDLVSPRTYRDFLLPVHQEMVSRIGGPVILHICGNCADRLRLFVEAGFHAYHFEWQVDSKFAVETVDHEMSLVGNIANVSALLNGTPEDVRKQVRYAIEAGVDIIAPECAIPLSTPLRNLKAIAEAAKEGW